MGLFLAYFKTLKQKREKKKIYTAVEKKTKF